MKVRYKFAATLVLALLNCGNEVIEVSIDHPVDGSVVSGVLRISADASDNVVKVTFYVNDSCLGEKRQVPFAYVWNTYTLSDSSNQLIYAVAEDRKGNEVISESVEVKVYNGNVVFADDFEAYESGFYPEACWFEIWMGAGSIHTYVEDGVGLGGSQGFRLRGLNSWVRTDGVVLMLDSVQALTYETSLMIPSTEPTGALLGFFVHINPQLGTIYNGIWFSYADSLLYARGVVEDSTGYTWQYDMWYSVRVTIDYAQLRMNAWLDDTQVVFDLPAVPIDWTDTFALATEHGKAGLVYYDDINIFESADSNDSHTAFHSTTP
jgi:hypothetical protein